MSNSTFDFLLGFESVTILKNVFSDDVLKGLKEYLYSKKNGDDVLKRVKLYSDFVSKLFENGCDLGKHLQKLLFEDENIYVVLKSQNKKISLHIMNALSYDLRFMSRLSAIKYDEIEPKLDGKAAISIPTFESTSFNFVEEYKSKIERLSKDGYGIYSKFSMFKIDNSGNIIPVKSADTRSVDDLIGYEKERGKVIDNTKALLAEKPAANMLLYGAAGTGKSSTVKATANLLSKEGVRLIEVKKERLMLLPSVMEEIAENPLKFIIFIDDLTFNNDEKGFGTLKAILEGSASAKAKNAVIYATSNRRHMVKETFSDRNGDDIHRNDTIAERTSLSERFGLSVLFDKPNKFRYLAIVKALAEKAGIEYTDEIGTNAEAFAMRKSGRSARCARQFVDNLLSTI